MAEADYPYSLNIYDPSVFHCCNCSSFLTIPILECNNGHIFCNACHSKLEKKCKKCRVKNTLRPSRAIEKLVQSIRISCIYEKHGCRKRIKYDEKRYHEEECIYVPYSCPFSGCEFVARSELLSNHFSHNHGDSRIEFKYDSPFFVTLKSNDDGTIILQEQNVGKLFILNNFNLMNVVNAINICCIGPTSFGSRNTCDILVKSHAGEMKLQSYVESVQQVNIPTRLSNFLVIPFGCFGPLKLKICITSPMVTIFVSDINQKTMAFQVKISDTVANVKKMIRYKRGYGVHSQSLIFSGCDLKNNLTLADYKIGNNSNIFLSFRLLGS